MNWLCSTFIGACLAALGSLAHAGDSQFVTRQGIHFYLHDKPYYFAGTNLWYGAYLGAPAPIGDRERLGKELDALKALGITNLRVLAMSEASELKRAVRYRAVFELLEKRAAEGAPVAGTNFWAWGGLSTESNADYMWKPGDAFMGDPPQEPQGLYSVFDTDAPTLAIIRAHAAAMSRIGGPR